MAETIISADPSVGRDENQLVTFYLGEEEFGFDIMSIHEIIRQPELTRIPMVPDYVEGIANLRGMILPVIDTRSRFGMPRVENTDRTRVLVVDVDGTKTGLRVDRVRQVTRIQQNQMEKPPGVIGEGMKSDYLNGVVKLDNGKRIILSLDPKSICKVSLDEVADRPILKKAVAGSAEAAKSHMGDQSVVQLVSFKLGQEEFAFRMDRVREILRVDRPNEMPNTPKYVLGVLTVRGNILPVIDLRLLLGLSNMESEVVEAVAEISKRFSVWSETFKTWSLSGTAEAPDASGPESLRQWIAAFTTSSQTLMEILSKVRTMNDKLVRSIEQWESTKTADFYSINVAPEAEGIVKLLDLLQSSIKENIREDQRLIVVQTQHSLLALLVDKVREVLSMPKGQIDPPPHLSDSLNVELSGVAKLDNGKRLILLLDSNNLIKENVLKKLDEKSQQTDKSMTQKHQVGGDARSLGEQQFVTFRLGDGEYGIPIGNVQEIDRSSKMTRVPHTADYVDGITNLRGEVVPVINARKRFGLDQKEPDERTRVIIMDAKGMKTGLLVDSVREVLSLPTSDIAAPPASLSTNIDRHYISGIGKVNDGKRMIVLLSVEMILKK